MGVGWVALLVGARIDCCHSHTGFDEVTDVGLKAFSAAVGSSTTITTVTLACKCERLVTLACVGPCVGVHARVLGQEMAFGVVCLCACVLVRCVCVRRSARRVDVGAGPHQQVARAWVFGGWRSS